MQGAAGRQEPEKEGKEEKGKEGKEEKVEWKGKGNGKEKKRVIFAVTPLALPKSVTTKEVEMAEAETEDMEEFSDMEGIQREGLFESQHAPPSE